MSEEHVKATSEVSDAAAVKADIPAEPTPMTDGELGEVAGGVN